MQAALSQVPDFYLFTFNSWEVKVFVKSQNREQDWYLALTWIIYIYYKLQQF